MANFFSITLVSVLLIFQGGLSFNCYECDPRLDINCANPKLAECFANAAPTVKLLISTYKPACMTLVAHSILGTRIVGKNCIVDLSSTGMDQCAVAKRVAMNTAAGAMYNVTCEICKTDSCNSHGTVYIPKAF